MNKFEPHFVSLSCLQELNREPQIIQSHEECHLASRLSAFDSSEFQAQSLFTAVISLFSDRINGLTREIN